MIAAFLFDLDGTLIATDDLHAEVFAEIGARHGVLIDRARYDREIHGRLNEDIFGDLFPGEDPQVMADEKEARFRERLGGEAQAMPGLGRLLDWTARRDLPTAIVTNAPRANADAMLAAIGLANRFDIIIAGGDLPQGKPDPLPYRTAAERLSVAPEGTIAFEDSPSGVRSATGAGATVFGVRSSLDDGALRDAGAFASIADFDDPALWAYLEKERA
jgi:HAD superfamily hydrolase (TIGR01509 family)